MSSSQTSNLNDEFQARSLKGVSRSFALTIPQLPPQLARAASNAYLICRINDTIEDDPALTIDQKQYFFGAFNDVVDGKLPAGRFADELSPLLSGDPLSKENELVRNTPSVMQIFTHLNPFQQAEIRRCVKTMSSGMLKFQRISNPEGLDTLRQMNDYCYYVAGVVGEMLTGLFCDYSGQIERKSGSLLSLAASFGQGLQMTNILKDVWEDKQKGVCWLPKDVFHQAGFELSALYSGTNNSKFAQGLYSLLAVTHGHLQNALAYTLMIPSHETGIRKFCYWAVGLALGTLQKINHTPSYTCAKDVTLSRSTTRRILMASSISIRSNFMLKLLFKSTARGLPSSEIKKDTLFPLASHEGLPENRLQDAGSIR